MDVKTTPDTGIFKNGRSEVPVPNQGEQVSSHLREEEKEYIALRLSYPEKFWKCANTYYNSNKAWISSKSVEKLRLSIEQNEVKKAFLEQIFSFHLDN